MNFLKIFMYVFCLCWVFVVVHGLSLVPASGAALWLWCMGFLLQGLPLLLSTGSRHTGSVVVVLGLGCSVACGILPDQES